MNFRFVGDSDTKHNPVTQLERPEIVDEKPNVYDTNISDDIKVSRHSFGSLEGEDDSKMMFPDKTDGQPISLTFIQGEPIAETLFTSDVKGVNSINIDSSHSQPSSIISISLDNNEEKTINTINLNRASEGLTITHDNANCVVVENDPPVQHNQTNSILINDVSVSTTPTQENKTYVTEIQVLTPKSVTGEKHQEQQQQEEDEEGIPEYARNSEIKFSTSTYESQPKSPDKRLSQIELLRSNFEKNAEGLKTSTVNLTKPVSISKPNLSPSKIPVFNSSKLSDSQKSPNKYTSSGSVSVTAIKTGSRNPSGK